MTTDQTLRSRFRNLLPSAWKNRDQNAQVEERSHSALTKPMRIALWAIAISVLAGVIDLGLPAEDLFRAVRAEIRSQEAPDDIVVVMIDDKTLNALKSDIPDRKQDAELVDKLFAAGASRVFFDKAFADPTSAESDQALADALKRHDEVYLAIAPEHDEGIYEFATLEPIPLLRQNAKVATMVGQSAPFNLSYVFPTGAQIDGQFVPSISGGLAGYKGAVRDYRLDFGIDLPSIKRVSYADVLKGSYESGTFTGAAVVIGQTFTNSGDMHYEPLGSKIPGVYFHALGAHTLRNGLPLDLGWIPALLFSAGLVAWQSMRVKPSHRVNIAAAAILLAVPLALDFMSIGIDVFPALLCLAIGASRLEWHSRKMFDEATGCLRVEAIESMTANPDVIVFALKIREFALITWNSTDQGIVNFIEEGVRRLCLTEDSAQFAFHKDTIVWMRPRMSAEDLSAHLAGLHALFRTGIVNNGKSVDVSAHIGVDQNYQTSIRGRISTALQSAEDAAQAGTHAIIADADYLQSRSKRLGLLSDLDEAMARNTVAVSYQPKIDLKTRTLIGAEALLRWTHPEHGPVPPEELVAMAEAHNRIDDLTMYVIDTALAAAHQAIAIKPNFQISINMSAISLTRVQLLYDMSFLMAKHHVSANNIILEITETAPLEDRRVEAILRGLQEFGIRLSIDDFGTGQSAFSYIKRVPGSEVKIDRSFIADMETSAESRAVVQATIDMAHSLDRHAVAEGVENLVTEKLLIEMGCDHAQGFLYSKAVPMAELLGDIAQRPRRGLTLAKL